MALANPQVSHSLVAGLARQHQHPLEDQQRLGIIPQPVVRNPGQKQAVIAVFRVWIFVHQPFPGLGSLAQVAPALHDLRRPEKEPWCIVRAGHLLNIIQQNLSPAGIISQPVPVGIRNFIMGIGPETVTAVVLDQRLPFGNCLLRLIQGALTERFIMMHRPVMGGIGLQVTVKCLNGIAVLPGVIIHQPSVELIHRLVGIDQRHQPGVGIVRGREKQHRFLIAGIGLFRQPQRHIGLPCQQVGGCLGVIAGGAFVHSREGADGIGIIAHCGIGAAFFDLQVICNPTARSNGGIIGFHRGQVIPGSLQGIAALFVHHCIQHARAQLNIAQIFLCCQRRQPGLHMALGNLIICRCCGNRLGVLRQQILQHIQRRSAVAVDGIGLPHP